MALFENLNGYFTGTAAADLSTKQYYAVKFDTSGRIAVAGAGECAVGILYDNVATAAGKVCSVARLNGQKLKAKAGGTITAGDLLAVNASGLLVTATKAYTNTSDGGGATDALIGSHIVGIAIDSAVANDLFQFYGQLLGAVPTTAA